MANAQLAQFKTKSQVTIPARIRDEMQLSEGDILEVSVRDGRIILTPQRIYERGSVEAAVAEGQSDLAKGRVTGPFKTVSAFKRAVKRPA